ncbi:MAG: GIY-YIG nuclease family protein [Chlorobi bacterium]|nr:GIY-YIG nuclease family protein [Chlorobiota bacterium]
MCNHAKKYFTYVIKSAEGLHYTGMTEDLELRLKQHNDKSLSFWTKRGSDWKIIFSKCFNTKRDALAFEKRLKSGVGRDFLKKNIPDF